MAGFDGRRYQARFDELAASGFDIHGEAALVLSYHPETVLDAGCGTGRVSIELARHGIAVVGVDVDRSMIAEARRRAPDLEWVEADLADLRLGRRFDVVILAGNVPVFCPEPRRRALAESCAEHVAPGGRLIAGFQIDRGYTLDEWDTALAGRELDLEDRWSTWSGGAFQPGGDYAVSVHRRRFDRGPAGQP